MISVPQLFEKRFRVSEGLYNFLSIAHVSSCRDVCVAADTPLSIRSGFTKKSIRL